MFNISYNLNKKSPASVIFADKNLKFSNYLNYFSKNQLDQIIQLKESFVKEGHATGDLWEKGKKHKIIVFKIKEKTKVIEDNKDDDSSSLWQALKKRIYFLKDVHL